MANIIVYDPDNAIVENIVAEYAPSANTNDYLDEPNKLVNPDLSGVDSVERKYWKVDNSLVVEMNSSEKELVDNAVNPILKYPDGYQVNSRNYVTLLDIDKALPTGEYLLEFSYSVSSSRSNRYAVSKVTVDSDFDELATFCIERNLFSTTFLKRKYVAEEDTIVNIKFELKAPRTTTITIHDLIIETRKTENDIPENSSLSI